MQEIATAAAMRAWSDEARRAGRRIGLVPTMGYLHAGHISLVAEARRRAETCVASIFVNPMQFGANEDLSRYPRDLPRDREALQGAGVDVLYLPTADEMYPPGFQTEVTVTEVSGGLCGASRPGHFRGVTTVVTKLFNAVKPHVAVFGEKDFQQLAVIRRMANDLDTGIEVIGAPIVRETDGLAMSSRNAYLSREERAAALCLSRALAAARTVVADGTRDADAVLSAVRAVIDAEPAARVDYVELVDADSLQPVPRIAARALLALAVFLGRTRLIDNTILTASNA